MGRRRGQSEPQTRRMQYAQLNIAEIYGGVIGRRAGDEDPSLIWLAASIARHGLLQPVLVRTSPQRGRYVLICGARRLAACRMAGLKTVDAMVLEADEPQAVACFLEEQMTREAPGFLEEAQAIRRCGPERVEEAFALPQALLNDRLRMLALGARTQETILRCGLTLEQARPLLLVGDTEKQEEAALIIAQRGLSGMQAHRLVCGPQSGANKTGRRRALSAAVAALNETIEKLRAKGTNVQAAMYSQEDGICIQISLKNPDTAQQSAGKGEKNENKT